MPNRTGERPRTDRLPGAQDREVRATTAAAERRNTLRLTTQDPFPVCPSGCRIVHQACLRTSPRIGRERIRMPVAATMALPMAGGTAMIGVSPPPTGGVAGFVTR